MRRCETENYIFHFREGSTAERDIVKIARLQEACFAYITRILKTMPDFKIEYFLCETPEDVGRVYGDDEPCNGFTALPNKIYAVYNETVQCVGFHEDAHVISYLINRPDSRAVREGVAMYFDRKWWGIENLDWTGYFIRTGRYIPVKDLLDDEVFSSADCAVTYPIAGAFTQWLISSYGIEKYLQFYRYENPAEALPLVYGQTAEALGNAFADYAQLFRIDEVVEQRMEKLAEA